MHDECLNQLKHLRFDPDGDNQVVTISLYCSLVEYVGALLALTDKQSRTGFSSVFRSYLEGCAELKNLLSDDDFYFRKEATYHREWFRVLKKVGPDNPYLKGIGESENLAERTAKHSDRLKELEREGHPPMSIKKSFYKAGMKAEYDALYNFESGEAHNDIRALRKRNVKLDAAGKATVEAYMVPSPNYYLARLDHSLVLLLELSEAIHDHIKSKGKDAFKPHREAMDKLHADALAADAEAKT